MWWVIVVIFIVTAVVITIWWPSEELQELPCSTLPPKNTCYKLLDIRDALDFEAGHVPGAVNISLGRLPYVANKDLELEHPIIIVGKKDRKSKKAARILKKKGFHHIYVCVDACS
ncbi:rhodanese-like domain-containing protein [Paenibacillus sp. FA6]|uniref:rhodanese-like domain-containing protein n=1 Tax=Paenibacillus sp. FA6 TaxID=3413029 RepID=UPI003F65CCD1